MAKSLFEGCPSGPVIGRFAEFGKPRQMPENPGKWLNTPADHYVAPQNPFDSADFVGMAGAYKRRCGTDLVDIKYMMMTCGHFDHVGGAASLKPCLPNARFVMTQGGRDEAVETTANPTAVPAPGI